MKYADADAPPLAPVHAHFRTKPPTTPLPPEKPPPPPPAPLPPPIAPPSSYSTRHSFGDYNTSAEQVERELAQLNLHMSPTFDLAEAYAIAHQHTRLLAVEFTKKGSSTFPRMYTSVKNTQSLSNTMVRYSELFPRHIPNFYEILWKARSMGFDFDASLDPTAYFLAHNSPPPSNDLIHETLSNAITAAARLLLNIPILPAQIFNSFASKLMTPTLLKISVHMNIPSLYFSSLADEKIFACALDRFLLTHTHPSAVAYRLLCAKINHNSPNRARADTLLDVSVLSKNRLWRTIGSSKLDLYRPLLPIHHTEASTASIIADTPNLLQHLRAVEPLEPSHTSRTLITIPPALQPPPPPPAPTLPPPKRHAVTLPQPANPIPEQQAVAHAIATHSSLHPNDTTAEETRTTEGMFGHKTTTVTFRRRTTHCPIANRTHHGNRSKVSVHLLTGQTSYRCYSTTCKLTSLNQPSAPRHEPPPVTPSLEPPPPTDTPPPGGGRPPD